MDFGAPDKFGAHVFRVEIPAAQDGARAHRRGLRLSRPGRRHSARRGTGHPAACRLVGHRRHCAPRVQRPAEGGQSPTGRWHTGTNLVDRLLGKELCVLAWAAETANADQIPVICSKWAALRPEERWWLFSMTVAEAACPRTRSAAGAARCSSRCPTARSLPRTASAAARSRVISSPAIVRDQPMSTPVTPFSLKDAPALIERLLPVQKLSAEAYKEQMAVQRQDAHRSRQLLEGPQAAHPQQGLYPRLSAAGHRRSGARPRDLREAHGDGRRIFRRPLEASPEAEGDPRHALHRPHHRLLHRGAAGRSAAPRRWTGRSPITTR